MATPNAAKETTASDAYLPTKAVSVIVNKGEITFDAISGRTKSIMPLILSRTTSGAVDGSSSSARIASPPAASSPLPDAYDAAEKVVPCALTPLLCRCRLRLRRCRCPCFSLLLFVTPNQWEKTLLSPSPPFPFPSSSSSSSFHLEMADGAFKDPRRMLLLLDCAVKKDDDVDDERAAKRFLLSIFLMCVVILSLFFVKEVRDEKATFKSCEETNS